MVIGQTGIELTRFTHDSQQMKRSGVQPFEWCSSNGGFQASAIHTVSVRVTALFLLLPFAWCQCNSFSVNDCSYISEVLLFLYVSMVHTLLC
jgi:hypothetical protein